MWVLSTICGIVWLYSERHCVIHAWLRCTKSRLRYVNIWCVNSGRFSRKDLGSQRVLETALKTVQSCTGTPLSSYICLTARFWLIGPENGFIELSQKIIEVVAVRLDRLERPMESADKAQIVSATAGYYMARVHLVNTQAPGDYIQSWHAEIRLGCKGGPI